MLSHQTKTPKALSHDVRLAPKRRGLHYRLIRVFAIQASIVSIATAFGVYAAYKIAEDILVKEALNGEAAPLLELI